MKVVSFTSIFGLSVVLLLSSCSVGKHLDSMDSSTDHMQKSMEHMDKSLSKSTKDIEEQTKNSNEITSSVKAQTTSAQDMASNVLQLTQEQSRANKKIDADFAQLSKDIKDSVQKISGSDDRAWSFDKLRMEKFEVRGRAAANLSAATTIAIDPAAVTYVCEFDFRLWTPNLANVISQDKITAMGLREYLVKVGDYMLKEGVDAPNPMDVFADPTEPLAQLNGLIKQSDVTTCPVPSTPGYVNNLNFYQMLAEAFTHEKSKAKLSETDQVALGVLRGAATFVLQAYHNLYMAEAIELSMKASDQKTSLFNPENQDPTGSLHPFQQAKSDIAKFFDDFLTRHPWTQSTWTFDLKSASTADVQNIHRLVMAAIDSKNNLKVVMGIEPQFDAHLTALIKEMRSAKTPDPRPEAQQIFNLITQQYL